MPHGFGEYEWKDGKKYVGEFVMGALTGQGIITRKDGHSYKGMFRDGKAEG